MDDINTQVFVLKVHNIYRKHISMPSSKY